MQLIIRIIQLIGDRDHNPGAELISVVPSL